MTESDYIIIHLRMDIDKQNKAIYERDQEIQELRFQVVDLHSKVSNLEYELSQEWGEKYMGKIHYCSRCGKPMYEPAWTDETNEYCDICASDMGYLK